MSGTGRATSVRVAVVVDYEGCPRIIRRAGIRVGPKLSNNGAKLEGLILKPRLVGGTSIGPKKILARR